MSPVLIPNAVFIVFNSLRSTLRILASHVIFVVPRRALSPAIQTYEFPILGVVLRRQHLLAIGEMSKLQSERM